MTSVLATSRRNPVRRLVAVLAFVVVLAGLGAVTGQWFFGHYRVYVVHTGSMEPAFMPGDVIVDRRAAGPLAPGDVITFRYAPTSSDVVTHRIVSIDQDGTITTKGDGNATVDPWTVQRDQVQGSPAARIANAGYVVVYLQHPTGILSLAMAVICVAMLWTLFFAPPPPSRPTTAECRA